MAKYGKFTNAATLFEAYVSLEKEFTRKSQQLSALQKQLENGTSAKVSTDKSYAPPSYRESDALKTRPLKVNVVPNDFTQNFQENEGVDNVTSKPLDKPSSTYPEEGDFLKLVLGNTRLADAVFQAYLSRLETVKAPKTIGGVGGNTPLTPPAKPKSLAEAAELSKHYFK